jgi:hypothetical protein
MMGGFNQNGGGCFIRENLDHQQGKRKSIVNRSHEVRGTRVGKKEAGETERMSQETGPNSSHVKPATHSEHCSICTLRKSDPGRRSHGPRPLAP